jgi:hypothetical protein
MQEIIQYIIKIGSSDRKEITEGLVQFISKSINNPLTNLSHMAIVIFEFSCKAKYDVIQSLVDHLHFAIFKYQDSNLYQYL